MTVTQSIQNGATLSGLVSWTATPSASVSKIEFYIDGTLKWTEGISPYVFNGDGNKLNTDTLTAGSHEFKVIAYSSAGNATAVATATVGTPAPPPTTDWETTVRNTVKSLSVAQPYTMDQLADVMRKLLAGLA